MMLMILYLGVGYLIAKDQLSDFKNDIGPWQYVRVCLFWPVMLLFLLLLWWPQLLKKDGE
jgi:hypothetical protein